MTTIKEKYMDFVYEMHKTMVDQKLTLVYEGEVNQSITKAFTAMTERQLEKIEDSSKTKRRLYHVMVECLQNICKHAGDHDGDKDGFRGSGIFMVGTHDDFYTVTTGNIVLNAKRDAIQEILSKVNSLSPEEAKELHKKMIKESRLSEKAGAGLGFIDIVKKTGNQIDFRFIDINNETSFMILNSTVTRD